MITKEMKSETRRHKLTSGNSENYGWCCKGLVWREQCFDQRIKLLEKQCILLIAVMYVCGVTENRSRKTEVVHWVMVGWNWSRRNMIRISSRELKNKKNKISSRSFQQRCIAHLCGWTWSVCMCVGLFSCEPTLNVVLERGTIDIENDCQRWELQWQTSGYRNLLLQKNDARSTARQLQITCCTVQINQSTIR